MKLSPNIIIHVDKRVRGHNRGYVPAVPTPVDRYREFSEKLRRHENTVPVNNYPWKFRQW